ncbi:hypothetical protein [Alteribacillus iranensis]|nr:hypothetical protein [Alteribacillus iranensis]
MLVKRIYDELVKLYEDGYQEHLNTLDHSRRDWKQMILKEEKKKKKNK